MDYNFQDIEKKWRLFWAENKTNQVGIDPTRPKYYVLDMFPYPSGAGLHVGHPLGYIATDIVTRYKKLSGFNVLHPMGYDSFGLPAEQYAIQTGQHPAITIEQNVKRYREQLDQLGFAFDWSREVKTSDPNYYKWTQWIFKRFFSSFYDLKENKAKNIDELVKHFEHSGTSGLDVHTSYTETFSASDWTSFSSQDKNEVLLHYRLAFLSKTWVNWCPKLGTVLANDEVVNGLSVRGAHPVVQKEMMQWSLRIKAYADRLLEGLSTLDWSDSIKEQQKNWIGKSEGAVVTFEVEGLDEGIQVFTTRPDTIFGVGFMVLAPEHALVETITLKDHLEKIQFYKKLAAKKSERERQAEVDQITGEFTGAYAIHPFTKKRLPIWIADYVLVNYGTGAIMAVPSGDQRDMDFAKKFNLEIPPIFKGIDLGDEAFIEKTFVLENSDFLNGLDYSSAFKRVLQEMVSRKLGEKKINYRLRDAVFSRQRYWGEPFPIYYEDGIPKTIEDGDLPLDLPHLTEFLPTEHGEPPLARAQKEDWKIHRGTMDFNTMPGWAGSSWYFIRYLDSQCKNGLASEESLNYWGNVDLYVGGNEHATGHLLYARFWTKFLFDLNLIPFDEPFKKLVNQGMILGRSSFVYRLKTENTLVSLGLIEEYDTIPIHVDISLVQNNKLNIEAFKNWLPEYKDVSFILEEDGSYVCGHEIEKMSKSKFNVQTPDELVEKFGADTLRMYEMFLGPVEQSKPWDTNGITGVHGFLKKYWRLFHLDGQFVLKTEDPPADALRILHKTIKKITDDIERFSLNTGVSSLMIALNELTDLHCNNKSILKDLTLLLHPYAPHITEEIWELIGEAQGSISQAKFPIFDPKYLELSEYDYPVSFNGKLRFKHVLKLGLTPKEIELEMLQLPETKKWLEGKEPKKVIIVPQKIINFVTTG